MQQSLTRRRFLAVSAAAAVLPGAARGAAPVARWQGVALGAPASMTLVGLAPQAAAAVFAAVEREVARLEDIFSLHLPGSAVCRLNAAGRLADPPPELLEVLRLCADLNRVSAGAFDPTIQPLWLLQAARRGAGRAPRTEEIAAARRRCGWQHLSVAPGLVAFARPGMALTLNGVAQGYIADRVAGLLRRRGLTDVLVDMGEIAALGGRPDGSPWRAAVARPDGRILRQVTLSERALATSAPRGTLLDPAGRIGHILDPRDGQPGGRWQLVSVSAPRAALADGLSTAFCLMPRGAIAAALRRYPEATLETLV